MNNRHSRLTAVIGAGMCALYAAFSGSVAEARLNETVGQASKLARANKARVAGVTYYLYKDRVVAEHWFPALDRNWSIAEADRLRLLITNGKKPTRVGYDGDDKYFYYSDGSNFSYALSASHKSVSALAVYARGYKDSDTLTKFPTAFGDNIQKRGDYTTVDDWQDNPLYGSSW